LRECERLPLGGVSFSLPRVQPFDFRFFPGSQEKDTASPSERASGGNDECVPVEGLGELRLRRSVRARRYRLTLGRDGIPVATIPLRGTRQEAIQFAQRQVPWLERVRARQASKPRAPLVWELGAQILWRGEATELRLAAEEEPLAHSRGARRTVRLGTDLFVLRRTDCDLRPLLEARFLACAKVELPARAWELATIAGVGLRRVVVRSQRSRWGSCSSSGTVSLNWRLIQVPPQVRDYIIHHELAHLIEMNHSERFWREVTRLCPHWKDAEAWLTKHGSLLGL